MTAEQYEPIVAKCKGRMMIVMEKIRDVIRAAGYSTTDPEEWNHDQFEIYLGVYTSAGLLDDPPDLDVTFTIWDMADFDGQEDDGDIGLNLALTVTARSGRQLGGMTPFNYSYKCWVNANDDDAINDRLQIFENADPVGILECLEAYEEIIEVDGAEV